MTTFSLSVTSYAKGTQSCEPVMKSSSERERDIRFEQRNHVPVVKQEKDEQEGSGSPDRRKTDRRSPDRRSPDRRLTDRRSPDRRSPDRGRGRDLNNSHDRNNDRIADRRRGNDNNRRRGDTNSDDDSDERGGRKQQQQPQARVGPFKKGKGTGKKDDKKGKGIMSKEAKKNYKERMEATNERSRNGRNFVSSRSSASNQGSSGHASTAVDNAERGVDHSQPGPHCSYQSQAKHSRMRQTPESRKRRIIDEDEDEDDEDYEPSDNDTSSDSDDDDFRPKKRMKIPGPLFVDSGDDDDDDDDKDDDDGDTATSGKKVDVLETYQDDKGRQYKVGTIHCKHPKCKKTYQRRCTMLRHYDQDHLMFRINCPYCPYRAKSHSDLNRHVERKHTDKFTNNTKKYKYIKKKKGGK